MTDQERERMERLTQDNHRLEQENLRLRREHARMGRVLATRDVKANLVRDEVRDLDAFARLRRDREELADAARNAMSLIGQKHAKRAKDRLAVALYNVAQREKSAS